MAHTGELLQDGINWKIAHAHIWNSSEIHMMWSKYKLIIYFDKLAKQLFEDMPTRFGPFHSDEGPFEDGRNWMCPRECPWKLQVRVPIKKITLSQPFEEAITLPTTVRVVVKYHLDKRLGPRTSGRTHDGSDPWDQHWYAYDESTILIVIKDMQKIEPIFSNYVTNVGRLRALKADETDSDESSYDTDDDSNTLYPYPCYQFLFFKRYGKRHR